MSESPTAAPEAASSNEQDVRAAMVAAARAIMAKHAPHPYGALLGAVEPLEVTFRVAGDNERDGAGTRIVPSERTDTGVRRVEVAIGHEEAAPGAALLVFAVVAGLCDALPVRGDKLKERKLAAKALAGGAKNPASLSVRDLSKLEIGETSAIARAIGAAEEARAGRSIGTARALPPKRTGGRLMLRYSAEQAADGVAYLALPKPGLLSKLRLGEGCAIVLRFEPQGAQERGDEITLEAGTLVYVPNDKAKAVQDRPTE